VKLLHGHRPGDTLPGKSTELREIERGFKGEMLLVMVPWSWSPTRCTTSPNTNLCPLAESSALCCSVSETNGLPGSSSLSATALPSSLPRATPSPPPGTARPFPDHQPATRHRCVSPARALLRRPPAAYRIWAGHSPTTPPAPTTTAVHNVRRRDRLGGLLHEYQQVPWSPGRCSTEPTSTSGAGKMNRYRACGVYYSTIVTAR
jgi:hypothetical protein